MKWLKRLGLFLAALYLAAAVALYLGQERMLFHPRARSADHRYGNFPEEWVDLPDGERLNLVRVPGAGEGAILYLHGNRGDNGRSIYQSRELTGLGYDLFLVDYRGFGKSSGSIAGEEHLTEDLQAVYDRIAREYPEERILLAGYSLGSGPASYLAAQNDPAGLVLVAPYTSLTAMKNEFFWYFPDFLLSYELNNLRALEQADCPVRIIHGTADELIPFRMAEQLAAVDPGRIALTPLKGVGHRGAVLSEQFGAAVRGLLPGR